MVSGAGKAAEAAGEEGAAGSEAAASTAMLFILTVAFAFSSWRNLHAGQAFRR